VYKRQAKYIATSRVQTSRQEMIDELEPMSLHCLWKYMKWALNSQLVFYF
jgi:hypothetical protein